MHQKVGTVAAAVLLAISLPAAVQAQTAAPSVAGGSAGQTTPVGLSPNPNLNTPGEELRPVSGLPSPPVVNTGLFPSLGNQLLNDGIDIHGAILDHSLTNPSVGNTPGNTSQLAIFRPSIEFDLGRLLGIQGGFVHTSLTWWFSKSDEPEAIAQLGGALDGYQVTPIDEASVLTRLTYEQMLLQGKLSLEVGKSNIHQYFLIPNSLDPFSYDSPVIYADGDFNSIPYGVWMGKATYKLSPAWYLQGGLFEDEYARIVRYGWTFGDTGAVGVQSLEEVGYRTNFATEAYPANLEAGFEWNTRDGYSFVKGTGEVASRTTSAADYPGGGVVFFQGAKVVWRGPTTQPGQPPRNLQLYSQLDISVDKPQPFDLDASVGANLTGALPFRPNDILGFQARYLRLSEIEANFETEIHTLLNRRRFAGTQARDAFMFEGNYQIQVTRYATLSLYGQYFEHPDDYDVPFVNHVPESGFAAGAFVRIPLGPVLGTSSKVY